MVEPGFELLKTEIFNGFFSTGAEYKFFSIKSANKQSSYIDHRE